MIKISHIILGVASIALLCPPVLAAPADTPQPEQIPAANSTPTASGSFLSSYFARSSGDQANASHYLEQLLKDDPGNNALKGQLLVIKLINGEVDQAAALAQQLKTVDNHELIVDLLLALQQAKQGKFAAASEHLQGLEKQTSESVWIPLMQAWLNAGQGKLKEPLEATDFSTNNERIPPFLYYHLALLNDYANFPEAAERQYRLCVSDIAHAPYRAVMALANFYQRHNQLEERDKLTTSYANARPEGWKLIEKLATQETTIPVQRLIDNAQAGISEILFTMAGVLYNTDQAYDTQLYLQMAVYLTPDFPPAWLMLGNTQEASGSFADASRSYDMVSSKSALYHKALLRKAMILDKQGDPQQAIRMLDSLAAQRPDLAEPYIAKGDLLRGKSQFVDAVQAYTQAIERSGAEDPADWALYFARGACLERMGELQKAEDDLQRALKLNPDQPETLNYLGYMWLMQDSKLAQAADMIATAYDLRPDEPHIMDSMAWVYYKTGKLDKAIALLEEALSLMPADVSINDHLGDAYWQAGRKTEARYAWQKALAGAEQDAQTIAAINEKLQNGLVKYTYTELPEKPSSHAAHDDTNSVEQIVE